MAKGKLLKDLELVAVEFDNEGKKAVMTFLDEEQGEIREVNLNKQKYDSADNKFHDDEERAQKMEEVAKENFGLEFKNLAQAIGTKKDVWAYDKFNSLIEMKQIEKFEKDMVGQIIEGEIKEVFDDGIGIKIRFEYEDDLYESKMTYADYMESRNKWFVNPQKQQKQYERFEGKFGIPVEQCESLIGKKVLVEVRLAMGKFVWNDIKPLPKAKEDKKKKK